MFKGNFPISKSRNEGSNVAGDEYEAIHLPLRVISPTHQGLKNSQGRTLKGINCRNISLGTLCLMARILAWMMSSGLRNEPDRERSSLIYIYARNKSTPKWGPVKSSSKVESFGLWTSTPHKSLAVWWRQMQSSEINEVCIFVESPFSHLFLV